MPGIFPGQNVQNGAVNRGLRFRIGAESLAAHCGAERRRKARKRRTPSAEREEPSTWIRIPPDDFPLPDAQNAACFSQFGIAFREWPITGQKRPKFGILRRT